LNLNCPLTGKPCLKHKAYTVTEKKDDYENSYAVCEDCMYLRGEAPSAGDHEPCPSCGCVIESIVGTSRVGCAKCYDHFSEPLAFIIEAVQGGANRHSGGVPESFKRRSAESVNAVAFASQVLVEMRAASREERYQDAMKLEATLSKVKAIISRADERGELGPEERTELADVVYEHMYPGSGEGV